MVLTDRVQAVRFVRSIQQCFSCIVNIAWLALLPNQFDHDVLTYILRYRRRVCSRKVIAADL